MLMQIGRLVFSKSAKQTLLFTVFQYILDVEERRERIVHVTFKDEPQDHVIKYHFRKVVVRHFNTINDYSSLNLQSMILFEEREEDSETEQDKEPNEVHEHAA